MSEEKKDVDDNVGTDETAKPKDPPKDPKLNDLDVDIQDVDVKSVADKFGPPEKTFTMRWTTHEGKTVTGTFTAIRPNLGLVGQIAINRARLNQGEQLDVATDWMHAMMATLAVCLKTSPAEWEPEKLFDTTPLQKLHGHVEAWLKTFRRSVG